MKDFIDSFRYDFPRLYFLFITTTSLLACAVVFMALPSSPFLTSIGVTSTQQRMSALSWALIWESRVLLNAKGDQSGPIKSVWGNLAGLDKEGKLLVSVPSGKSWKIEAVRAADTKIINLYGAAGLVNQFKSEDALLDYYPDDQVVIWIRDVPFNVKLIEAGFAVPEPNPPTNIVDAAFASYYWLLFHGEKND